MKDLLQLSRTYARAFPKFSARVRRKSSSGLLNMLFEQNENQVFCEKSKSHLSARSGVVNSSYKAIWSLDLEKSLRVSIET